MIGYGNKKTHPQEKYFCGKIIGYGGSTLQYSGSYENGLMRRCLLLVHWTVPNFLSITGALNEDGSTEEADGGCEAPSTKLLIPDGDPNGRCPVGCTSPRCWRVLPKIMLGFRDSMRDMFVPRSDDDTSYVHPCKMFGSTGSDTAYAGISLVSRIFGKGALRIAGVHLQFLDAREISAK